MARGWESKSVEDQQAEASSRSAIAGPRHTPEQAARKHRQEGLLLARKHILQQLIEAQNSHHRKMLEAALAELDSKIGAQE